MINVLYVEKDKSEERKRATELLEREGLPHLQVIELSRKDIEERKLENFNFNIPYLLADKGIFPGLYNIEWYQKTFGRKN